MTDMWCTDSQDGTSERGLEQLEGTLMDFGRTLAYDDTEGFALLVDKLSSYAASRTALQDRVAGWIDKLQENFSSAWEGKQLSVVRLL